MRQSGDQLAGDGSVADGYDYDLQVWVVGGVVASCTHPASMGPRCCAQRIFAGQRVASIEGHQVAQPLTISNDSRGQFGTRRSAHTTYRR